MRLRGARPVLRHLRLQVSGLFTSYPVLLTRYSLLYPTRLTLYLLLTPHCLLRTTPYYPIFVFSTSLWEHHSSGTVLQICLYSQLLKVSSK